MTTKITSKGITIDQKDQYFDFIQVAAKKALKQAGTKRKGLQNLFSRGGEFQNYMIAGILRFSTKLPDYNLARSILGKDFISPEEIAKARGIIYTEEQIIEFGKAPKLQDEKYLNWCRDNNMMLIAGPLKAMSLLDIRDLQNKYFYSKTGGWYSNELEKFSREDKVEPSWIVLHKNPYPGSFEKSCDSQVSLVVDPMIIPNVAELAWGVTTYKAVRDIYLLSNCGARTSSLDSGGSHVSLHGFDEGGLGVAYWDDIADSYLGVAVARK